MKKDAADHLRESGAEGFRARVDQDISKGNGRDCAIDHTLAVFEHWLVLRDYTPVLAMLGAIAANYLDGDAIWLGLIGPPSSAKTEILNSTSMLPTSYRRRR